MTPAERAVKVVTESLCDTESVVRFEHPGLIYDVAEAIRDAISEHNEECAKVAEDSHGRDWAASAIRALLKPTVSELPTDSAMPQTRDGNPQKDRPSPPKDRE